MGNYENRETEDVKTSSVAVYKALIIGGIAVISVAIILTGVFTWNVFSVKGIVPGVSVFGVELGGMSEEQAEQLIEAKMELSPPVAQMNVLVGNEEFAIKTSIKDVKIGDAVSSAYAIGRTGNVIKRFAEMADVKKNGLELSFEMDIDEAEVLSQVQKEVSRIEMSKTDKFWEMKNDKLYIDRTKNAVSIDSKAIAAELIERIKKYDFEDMVYEIKVGETTEPNLVTLKSQIEREKIEPSLDLEHDKSGGTMIKGQAGIKIDEEAIKAALAATKDAVVEVPVELTKPEMSDSEFEKMLFRDVLSDKATSFNPSLTGRTKNVRLAAGFCGKILNPGEQFSYSDQLGRITREKGYEDALVFSAGAVENGLGGGVCQVSSTIYMAVIHADLKVDQRRNHSFVVSYTPVGEDATYARGGPDLKFTNNTNYPIKIVPTVSGSTLRVKIYGTNLTNKTVKIETTINEKNPFEVKTVVDPTLPAGTKKVKNEGYTGYKSTSYRVVYENGKEVSRTLENTSKYVRLDKVILVGPDAAVVPPVIPPVDPVVPSVDPVVPPVDPVVPPVDPVVPPVDPVVPPVDPVVPPVNPVVPPVNPVVPPVV